MREVGEGREWGGKELSVCLACEPCGKGLHAPLAGQLHGATWTSTMQLVVWTGPMCAAPMSPTIDLRIKPPDAIILLLQTESKIRAL